jgi:hypothetical protein
MAPVEPTRVADIKMTHKFRAIRLPGLNKQMKMITHENK